MVRAKADAAPTIDLRSIARFVLPLLMVTWLLLPKTAPAAASSYTLNWNTNQSRVTADIQSVDLLQVLKRIATATRWQIFVEPDSSRPVSAKFKELPPGEALRFLLGDLNYALIPGSNSSPRLFVFRTARDNATQLVAATDSGARKIANELLVKLKPGADIEEIARHLGAKVVGRLDKANVYRLRFEDEAAANSARERLAVNEGVETIDSNYSLERPASPRGVETESLPPRLRMRPPPSSGRVIVGLIDTAVQPLGNNLDQFVLKQISVAGPSFLDSSIPSHGTAMAETMLGGLQDATGGSTSVHILPIDVYGSSDATSTFDVAFGIVEAVNGGAKIVNLSLGSPGDNFFLREVVKNARDAGVLLISAAGNTPVTTPFYPAAYPEVHAVTALEHGQIAPYANRGSFVTLAAPGLNLVHFGGTSYGVEGTSVSSALLSGLAAGFMDAKGATTAQARTFLQGNFGVTITPRP